MLHIGKMSRFNLLLHRISEEYFEYIEMPRCTSLPNDNMFLQLFVPFDGTDTVTFDEFPEGILRFLKRSFCLTNFTHPKCQCSPQLHLLNCLTPSFQQSRNICNNKNNILLPIKNLLFCHFKIVRHFVFSV